MLLWGNTRQKGEAVKSLREYDTSVFEGLGPDEQWQAWEERATDVRPRIATGFRSLDDLLAGRGFAPGTLVILGGRTHTRKTTVMMNLIANMLIKQVPVGLIGLDEAPQSYVAKLASTISGVPHTELEENWGSNKKVRDDYMDLAKNLSITRGYRPDFDKLTGWLNTAEVTMAARPRVVFLDYVSLLTRDKYAGAENQRVSRLIEGLQVWTNEQEVVTVALHQVGRMDEGTLMRYHGDTPMTLESLKYGGEEIADIVLGTFRPSLNPLGNMTEEQARMDLGDRFDFDSWSETVDRVRAQQDTTYLQLLKNRPGVHLNHRGIALKSVGLSQQMRPADEVVNSSMLRIVEGDA